MPVGQVARRAAVGKADFAATQQGGTFVNLIKRIRANHHAGIVCNRVEYHLGEGKQCLAAAQHGQDFRFRIQLQAVIAACQPTGACLAQFGQARGQRIFGKLRARRLQGIGDHSGRGMFRLADLQHNRHQAVGWVDALQSLAQTGEGIGFELFQQGIHNHQNGWL